MCEFRWIPIILQKSRGYEEDGACLIDVLKCESAQSRVKVADDKDR